MGSQYTASLQRKLQEAGLQGSLDADAFITLLQYVNDVQGSLDVVYSILDVLKDELDDDGMITQQQMESAIRQLAGTTSERDLVFVIDAFDVPKISYDPITKRLYADNHPKSLIATAQAKHKLYLDRLYLLYQRLRRNKRFQPPNPVLSSRSGAKTMQAQLTELMALKGVVGQHRIVMGIISTSEDGSYTLEDVGATVPLNLSQAQVAAGFITENCVVVAEGEMGHDGVFKVYALGFPSCETRSQLPATAQKLNFFGAPTLSPEESVVLDLAAAQHTEDRLVFLSNVWLDKQETMDALHTIFLGFEEADVVPEMFVMMGNFCSRSCSGTPNADYLALKDGFSSLAQLIEQYPKIKDGSRFVFVPGPADPGLGCVLPQPPLPSFFTSEVAQVLPGAVFTTNPCRIKYYNKEIVVFRHDLIKQMRRRCLVPPAGLSQDNQDLMFAHMAMTVLQQSHLCPMPLVVQPVHWAFDHALQLYPLPDAVVLADGSMQASLQHEGCTVFNPGCLQDRMFSAYVPFQDEVEPSELPGAHDDSMST
eukprot:jgi/Chrzof1/762/Cz01g27210.t1